MFDVACWASVFVFRGCLGWFDCFDLFWLGLGNSVACVRILFVATIYVGLDLLLGLLFYLFVYVCVGYCFCDVFWVALVIVWFWCSLICGVWFDL